MSAATYSLTGTGELVVGLVIRYQDEFGRDAEAPMSGMTYIPLHRRYEVRLANGVTLWVPVNEQVEVRDAASENAVTTDALAAVGAAADNQGGAARRAARRDLAVRALREGMHPWTVAFYARLSEGYVRSLVPAAER